ncbi:hypothetical protein ACVT98_05550 [Vibrio campbellii]
MIASNKALRKLSAFCQKTLRSLFTTDSSGNAKLSTTVALSAANENDAMPTTSG